MGVSGRFFPVWLFIALALTAGNAKAQDWELTVWGTAVMQQIRDSLIRGYEQDPSLTSLEGLVQLRIQVDRAGRVSSPAVEKSSGLPKLDEAAIKAVIQASPLSKPPASLNPDKEFIAVVVPVQYQPWK